MKTTFLTNSKGQQISVGTKVKTYVNGGCECKTVVTALRPRTNEVIIKSGGYYKDVDEVEVIKK